MDWGRRPGLEGVCKAAKPSGLKCEGKAQADWTSSGDSISFTFLGQFQQTQGEPHLQDLPRCAGLNQRRRPQNHTSHHHTPLDRQEEQNSA